MGLGSLGQVAYDIIANDKTSEGVGAAQKGFDGLVITLGDLKDSFKEIDDIAQKISHKYASLSSYAEQAALSTGLTADATTDLIKELWSVDTPLEEAGNLIIELGRAGLTSEGDIRTVGAACDTLGDALGIPADKLANMLIPAFRAFGLQATDIPGKIDEIVYTLKGCNVNFEEWQKTLVKLGPDLAKMGLSIDDVNAILEVMKTHGIQGRDMLTELNKAMSDSSDTNKDGKVSLEEFNAALGISSDELTTQKNKLNESQGYAQKYADAANKMYTASDSFAQSVEELSTTLGPMADSLASITGPLTTISTILISLAGLKMAATFLSLGTSLGGIAPVAIAAGAALLPLAPILIGIGLGLAAIWALNELGVFKWIAQAGADFREFLEGAAGDFVDWITDLPGNVSSAIGGVIQWFEELPGKIGESITSIPGVIWDAFSGVGEKVGEAIGSIPSLLVEKFGLISEAFTYLKDRVQEAFSNLFTGISDFIVGLAQGFIAAGYNIIMYIVQGMQSAAGAVGSAISGILGIIGQYIPHSPAETGPLSQLPNFQAYFVDPLLAVTPAVQSAAVQVAAAATLPAAAAETTTNTSSTTTIDNSMAVGTINAGKEQSISDIMAEIATMQALKRTQRGITSG